MRTPLSTGSEKQAQHNVPPQPTDISRSVAKKGSDGFYIDPVDSHTELFSSAYVSHENSNSLGDPMGRAWHNFKHS